MSSLSEWLQEFVFHHVRLNHDHHHPEVQLTANPGFSMPGNSSTLECYWLPVTSTVDWCERNCEFSPYVVEFFNTISNLAILFPSAFGLWNSRRERLEKRFHFVHAMQIMVALGSFIFHGTLTSEGQFLDEYPMILAALGEFFVVVEAGRRPRPWLPYILGLYSMAVAAIILLNLNPIFFQASFISIVLYIAHSCYRRLSSVDAGDASARRLFYASLGMWLTAGGCWLVDYHACDSLEQIPFGLRNMFQMHAYWHLFVGVASFMSAQFLSYYRLKDLGYRPEISCKYILPYIRKTNRRVVKLD